MSSYDDIMGKRNTQPLEVEPDAPQKGMIDYGTPGQKVVLGPEDKEPDAAQGGGSAGGDVITGGGNTVGNTVGTAATPTDTGSTAPQQPRRYLSYDDIQQELKRQEEIMKRNRPETDAERAAREKKEKRNKMFAALGDGISALSNLYFTTKGAPNMYNPSSSLSEAAQRRIEMARQAREKELAAYNAAATARYGTLTDADSRAYKWDAMARQKQQDADNKARKDALAEAQAGKYKAAQDKDEAMMAYYQAKEKAIIEGLPLELVLLVAKAAKANAEAGRASRQGTSSWVGGSKGGSGSGSSKYSLFNEQTGQTETFATKGEFLRRAGELGYPTGAKSSSHSESDDGYGTQKKTDTSRSSNSVEANIGRQEAEAKRRYAEKHKTKPNPAAKKQKTAKSYKNTKALGL